MTPQETIAHLQSQLDECRKERYEDEAQLAASQKALAASQAQVRELQKDKDRFLESCASRGVKLIAQERIRHISEEGWTPAHDDSHSHEEMALAAATYAVPEYVRQTTLAKTFSYMEPKRILRYLWPWDMKWWKPTPHNRERELVKAGALIAAEIDRLQRDAATSARAICLALVEAHKAP
jgi:hypothetical protein